MFDLLLPFIAGIGGLALGGYLIYDRYHKKRQQQQHGKIIRILLYEQVGNEKVFRGVYTGEEHDDDKIGLYIWIQGLKRPIEVVNNNDFFPDENFGKCLMVCKYADDDFRAMARMRENEWYRIESVPPEEYFEMRETSDDDGNPKLEVKKDENGEPIVRKDEDGNPVPAYRPVYYEEPMGVKQSGREAMRFNRDFKQRMQEKRKENQGFFEKYGQMIMVISTLLIMFLGMAYMTNQTTDAMESMADTFGEKADEIVKSTQDPKFIEQVMEKVEQDDKEDESPPD